MTAVLCSLMLPLVTASPAAAVGDHPRLLFGADDVAGLRTKVLTVNGAPTPSCREGAQLVFPCAEVTESRSP